MFFIPNALRVYVAPLLLAILLAGCGSSGGGSPTSGNDEPPVTLNVTSGTFDVTATRAYDQCGRSTDYNGAYDVTIDGNTFAMGTEWEGSYNPSAASASAQSSINVVIDHRDCKVNDFTTVNVKFSSEDEFSGTITYRRRLLSGECDTSCITTWTIHGTRQGETP